MYIVVWYNTVIQVRKRKLGLEGPSRYRFGHGEITPQQSSCTSLCYPSRLSTMKGASSLINVLGLNLLRSSEYIALYTSWERITNHNVIDKGDGWDSNVPVESTVAEKYEIFVCGERYLKDPTLLPPQALRSCVHDRTSIPLEIPGYRGLRRYDSRYGLSIP